MNEYQISYIDENDVLRTATFIGGGLREYLIHLLERGAHLLHVQRMA